MTALTQHPSSPSRPPRDGLVRALRPGVELRSEGDSQSPTLFGHFAVFNRWTEIDSWFEGNFMERIAPGAFKKTFKEQRSQIRCLLQHGRDPQIGDKPIGKINVLREDGEGGYYETSLFDGLDPLVLEGLREGQYGASFRFRVMREEFVDDPGTSEYNPKGIPERTLKEMQIFEFGPVTFGAYQEATAGVRSLTDSYFFGRLAGTPATELRSLFAEAVPPANGEIVEVVKDDDEGETLTREAEVENTDERLDSEDAGTLAQMVALASCYIEDQDESDEASNVTVMQSVQSDLINLLNVEAAETEPDEPEDEEVSATHSDTEVRSESLQSDAKEDKDLKDELAPGIEPTPLRTSKADTPLETFYNAAPSTLTPLNTTVPRSRNRGNAWELPQASRLRKTPPPGV